MRVLYFTQCYPPETGAMAARAGDHACRWAAAGAAVTVIAGTPNYPTGQVPPGYRRPVVVEERDGVRVVRVPAFPTRYTSTLRRLASYGSYALSAFAGGCLGGSRPDVVLGTSPPLTAAATAAAVARALGVPFVLELRDLWPEGLLALGTTGPPGGVALLRSLARRLYVAAARVVVVTPGMRATLRRQGVPAQKLGVVANGVDVSRFHPAVPPDPVCRTPAADGRLLIGHVGTIGLGQDLATFVAALERLAGRLAVHAVLVGDGAQREALRALAAQRVPGRCTFLPPRALSEVPALLTALDVALVSTRWAAPFADMVPSKLFEAMACARPVVLAGHGESAALVASTGVGPVVAPGDPDALAAAIASLASDARGRTECGAAGPPYIRAHHDRDQLAAAMLGMLESTLR